MTQFEPSTDAQIAKKIADQVERPRVGRIKQVFEHLEDGDNSNFEVDVELIASAEKQHRAIPWQNPHANEIKIPKVGDKVIVEYHGGAKKSPIARSCVYTNETRAPIGRAGMWRKRVESGNSPAGDGDLYVESYTAYEENPASEEFDPDNTNPENSFVRISKKEKDNDNPVDGDTLPVMFELFDSPSGDEAYITLELNKQNGNDTANTWGIRFDLKTGEMKLLDADGYGIVSDGNGNFTWHYETIDYNKGSTTSL